MSSLKYLSTWFVFLMGVISFVYLPIFFYPTNIYYVLLSVLLLISFSIGYFSGFLTKTKKYYIYTSSFDYSKLRWPVILAYLIYTYIFIFIIGTETGAYADEFANKSQLSLYLQLIEKPIRLVFLFLLSSIVYNNKRFYFLVALLYLIISLSSNTRLDFVFSVIYWVGYGAYLGFFRIRLIYVLASLILFPFLATILLIKRVMKFESTNIFDIFLYLYETLTLGDIIEGMSDGVEFFQSYLIGLSVIDDNFIHPSSGIIRIFFLWIPRTLWQDKPESISRIIAKEYVPEAYYAGGGQTAGPIGDAFINAGVLGVIIFWILVGFYSSRSYSFLKRNCYLPSSPYKVYIWLIYFNFLSYLVYVMRGFGSDFFWGFLFQLLVIKTILLIGFKRVNS